MEIKYFLYGTLFGWGSVIMALLISALARVTAPPIEPKGEKDES